MTGLELAGVDDTKRLEGLSETEIPVGAE